MSRVLERTELANREARRKLPLRVRPYWTLDGYYGRHVGYEKRPGGNYWVARYRTLKGSYRRHRLGLADDRQGANGTTVLSYEQAWEAAKV